MTARPTCWALYAMEKKVTNSALCFSESYFSRMINIVWTRLDSKSESTESFNSDSICQRIAALQGSIVNWQTRRNVVAELNRRHSSRFFVWLIRSKVNWRMMWASQIGFHVGMCYGSFVKATRTSRCAQKLNHCPTNYLAGMMNSTYNSNEIVDVTALSMLCQQNNNNNQQ